MKLRRTASVAFLECIALAAPAVGSGEHAGHGTHGTPWATLFFTFVNFGLFLWLLARYVWPQVRLWLRERHAAVVQELQAAQEARRQAEELRTQWQQRLAGLDREIAQMREQLEADLARERDRVLEQARLAAEALRKDAERTVAAELRRVTEELRAEMVQRAVAVASEILRRQWSAADQERILEQFEREVRL